MVEYKYFNNVYKKVAKKSFQTVLFFLKMIGMTIIITLLFMFIAMTRIVEKAT